MFKRIILALILCLCLSSLAVAENIEIVNVIPERYALMRVTDVDPNKPLDKDRYMSELRKFFDDNNYEQVQIAIYDKGIKIGEGIRALGRVVIAEKYRSTDSFSEYEDKPSISAETLFIKCDIDTDELYSIYADAENEVFVKEIFQNANLSIFCIAEAVKIDHDRNLPYIFVPMKSKYIEAGIKIYVNKNDPELREVKKGSVIAANVTPINFINGILALRGNVFFIVKKEYMQ